MFSAVCPLASTNGTPPSLATRDPCDLPRSAHLSSLGSAEAQGSSLGSSSLCPLFYLEVSPLFLSGQLLLFLFSRIFLQHQPLYSHPTCLVAGTARARGQ